MLKGKCWTNWETLRDFPKNQNCSMLAIKTSHINLTLTFDLGRLFSGMFWGVFVGAGERGVKLSLFLCLKLLETWKLVCGYRHIYVVSQKVHYSPWFSPV